MFPNFPTKREHLARVVALTIWAERFAKMADAPRDGVAYTFARAARERAAYGCRPDVDDINEVYDRLP